MKFSCERQKLLDVMGTVQRAVATKSTHPALEGVLIRAKDGSTLSFRGYDFSMAITTTIQAEIEEEGSVVLNAKLFLDILRRFSEDQVYIDIGKDLKVLITCGFAEFSLVGIAASEFPELPFTAEDGDSLDVDAETLKSMIGQTIFCAAQTESTPIHTGLLFDISDGNMNIVALDGYRLAKRTETTNAEKACKFVVPAKTLSEIEKLLGNGQVSISLAKRHIIFSYKGYNFYSRLLEGEFVDYSASLPMLAAREIIIKTRPFIESLERMELLISEKIKSPVKCCFIDGVSRLLCITSTGRCNDEIPVNMTGDPIEIGFNNRYLLDALRNTGCDEVKLQITGGLRPITITPIDGSSFLFLVLPVRLPENYE